MFCSQSVDDEVDGIAAETSGTYGGGASASLDEFTSRLSADDSRTLVDLLKLAVAGRAGPRARDTLAQLLSALGRADSQVSGTRDPL